jgi:D-glycero-D-manno-heptose 1,7-bisphosphate phosphatase
MPLVSPPLVRRPAIFLDRDGVIVENPDDYCRAWEQVVILPGALRAMARARIAPYAVVIITNQSAIGRGLVDRATADDINARLVAEIRAAGGRIDGVFMCPHAPEAGCACRKPKPGLLLQAERDLSIDLPRSVLIGDALSDIVAARAAGVGRAMLVRTGRGIEQLALAQAQGVGDFPVYADLSAALDAFVGRQA